MSDKEKQKSNELEKAMEPEGEEEEVSGEEEKEEKAGPDDGCGNTGGGVKSKNAPTAKSACKSEDLTEDDLEKSLAKLEEYTEEKDVPTRRQVLLEKAQEGELTKSEQDELFQILGGGEAKPDSTLVEEVEKAMEPTEDMQKALDVSDFLSETHEENKRVNTVLAERIEKSDSRQQSFNLILAKAITDIGKLTKSVDERLAGIEGQPARKPKSQARPLAKSFANAEPTAGQGNLSKSQILETMDELFRKSIDAGNDGLVEGVNMQMASTKYEMTGNVSPQVLEMVKRHRSSVH